MAKCPLCGRKLTPVSTDPENRVVLRGMDLPICRECAEKRKQPKIGGAASPDDFYFKSGKANSEVRR